MEDLSNQVFSKELLDRWKASATQPKYTIGVDTYDKEVSAYAMSREIDGQVEFLLCKTSRATEEFEQEISNLAEYFDAEVFRTPINPKA